MELSSGLGASSASSAGSLEVVSGSAAVLAAAVDNCVVCAEGLDNGDAVVTLPCAHKLHEACLLGGLHTTSTSREDFRCPICRTTPNALVEAEGRLLSAGGGGRGRGVGASHAGHDDEVPDDPMESFIRGLGAARAGEANLLDQRMQAIEREKAAVQKEIKNKKARDKRLINRAAKDLTLSQVMEVAALKVAKGKGKGKGKAK